MTSLNKIPRGVTSTVGKVFAAWLNDVQRIMNVKISELTTAIESHIVVFDNSGGIQDSGKELPSGDVVGISDAQTLTNKTLTSPVLNTPQVDDFSKAIHDHSDDDNGGMVSHSDMSNLAADDHAQYHTDSRGDARYLNKANVSVFVPTNDYNPATKKYVDDKKAATQGDAPTASGDPADLTAAVTKTDFNSAVSVINSLIDKLQAAGLMT